MAKINKTKTYKEVDKTHRDYINLMERLVRYKSKDDNFNLPTKTYGVAVKVLKEIKETIQSQLDEIKRVNNDNLLIAEKRLLILKKEVDKVSKKFINDSKAKEIVLKNKYSIDNKRSLKDLEKDLIKLSKLRLVYSKNQRKVGVSLDLDDSYELEIKKDYQFVQKQIEYLEKINKRMFDYIRGKSAVAIQCQLLGVKVSNIDMVPIKKEYVVYEGINQAFPQTLSHNIHGFNIIGDELDFIDKFKEDVDLLDKSKKEDFGIPVIYDISIQTRQIFEKYKEIDCFNDFNFNDSASKEIKEYIKANNIYDIIKNFNKFITNFARYNDLLDSNIDKIENSRYIDKSFHKSFLDLYVGERKEKAFFVGQKVIEKKQLIDFTQIQATFDEAMRVSSIREKQLDSHLALLKQMNDIYVPYINIVTYVKDNISDISTLGSDLEHLIINKVTKVSLYAEASLEIILKKHFTINKDSIIFPVKDGVALQESISAMKLHKDHTDKKIGEINNDIKNIQLAYRDISNYSYSPRERSPESFVNKHVGKIALFGAIAGPLLTASFQSKYNNEKRYYEEQERLRLEREEEERQEEERRKKRRRREEEEERQEEEDRRRRSRSSSSSSSFSSGSSWGSSSSSSSSGGSFGGSNSW